MSIGKLLNYRGGHQKAAGASVKKWFKINNFIKDANTLAGEYKESIDYIK